MKTKLFAFGFAVAASLTLATHAFAATPVLTLPRITGMNTVTLLYSEPVNTTASDYSDFTGALAGRTLTSLSGSGTNTITLTFSGSAFAPDATGGITVANSVTSSADNSALSGGTYNVLDGQPPKIATISISSNQSGNTVARPGNTITVTFMPNEAINNTPTVKIDTTNVTASGYGSGVYTANYTITPSDTPDIVPVVVNMTDIAGNQGVGTVTLAGSTGSNVVSITSNATTPGTLSVGDSITFTMTLAAPLPNATVSGSYDGVPLSWSTNNGGATYTATYTVQSGNSTSNVPLQITGVTVRDSSGNVSAPVSGTDVQRTISTQSFSISVLTQPSSLQTTNQPRFDFYSSQEGIINYGGDCTSASTSAMVGNNYITFSPLANGYHSNCTLSVTNNAGYKSDILAVTPFTVSAVSNPVQTTTQTLDCSNGSMYDPLTGQACPTGTSTTQVVTGCTTGDTFSSTTGQACPATSPAPAVPGCTAGFIFSPINGQVCDTTVPAITTTTPTTPVATTTDTTTTTTPYHFTLHLAYGSTGTEVTELQKRLIADGYLNATATGYFGSATEQAVKDFQKAHGLTQLGSVGPGTRVALNAEQ